MTKWTFLAFLLSWPKTLHLLLLILWTWFCIVGLPSCRGSPFFCGLVLLYGCVCFHLFFNKSLFFFKKKEGTYSIPYVWKNSQILVTKSHCQRIWSKSYSAFRQRNNGKLNTQRQLPHKLVQRVCDHHLLYPSDLVNKEGRTRVPQTSPHSSYTPFITKTLLCQHLDQTIPVYVIITFFKIDTENHSFLSNSIILNRFISHKGWRYVWA